MRMKPERVKDNTRINERIRCSQIRLIADDGEQHGVVTPEEGLRIAQEKGLDLVEISPNAVPPVCKIMDYGRYKFESAKKQQKARQNQKQVLVKEMTMRPKIDTHDLQVKAGHIRRFLERGDRVKVTIRFRGREMAHTHMGRALLDKVAEMMEDIAKMDKNPAMEGRTMHMILFPKAAATKKGKSTKDDEKVVKKEKEKVIEKVIEKE